MLGTVAAFVDVLLAEGDGVCECPGPNHGHRVIHGGIVGHPAPCQGYGSCEAGGEGVEFMARVRIEEEIEVGAYLQTKALSGKEWESEKSEIPKNIDEYQE